MSTPRHVMYKTLEPLHALPPEGSRPVTTADGELLGHLMYHSYLGTIDYDGETLDQAIQEMSETLTGKYGKVNFPASLAVIDGGTAVAAVIFVDHAKLGMPLLAFTMTHPKFQGRGLAQGLITSCLRNLQEQAFAECCLVVTKGNRPAEDIYKKLGFSLTRGTGPGVSP